MAYIFFDANAIDDEAADVNDYLLIPVGFTSHVALPHLSPAPSPQRFLPFRGVDFRAWSIAVGQCDAPDVSPRVNFKASHAMFWCI